MAIWPPLLAILGDPAPPTALCRRLARGRAGRARGLCCSQFPWSVARSSKAAQRAVGRFRAACAFALASSLSLAAYICCSWHVAAADYRGGEVGSDCYGEVQAAGSKPPAAVSPSRFFLVASVLSSVPRTEDILGTRDSAWRRHSGVRDMRLVAPATGMRVCWACCSSCPVSVPGVLLLASQQ